MKVIKQHNVHVKVEIYGVHVKCPSLEYPAFGNKQEKQEVSVYIQMFVYIMYTCTFTCIFRCIYIRIGNKLLNCEVFQNKELFNQQKCMFKHQCCELLITDDSLLIIQMTLKYKWAGTYLFKLLITFQERKQKKYRLPLDLCVCHISCHQSSDVASCS